jgi:predicted dinucleotide-binding enzyme
MLFSFTRRRLVGLAGLLAAAGLVAHQPAMAAPAPVIPHPIPKTSGPPLKIGVVGSGQVGGALGEVWLRAGHQVMFSDKNPATVKAIIDRLPNARGGTTDEAVAFADVVLLTVPYMAMPEISRDLGPALRGKIVFDTGNPNLVRDGDMARTALAKGSGLASAEFLPGARLVRGFSSFGAGSMASEAHRPGEKAGVMLASNDPQALATGVRLVRDAGFDPVVVGDLASARRFELGTPVAGVKTAAQIRGLLNLQP